MSTDLDLVNDFMHAEEVSASELLIARSILDEAIASEIEEDGLAVPLDRASQVRNRSSRRRIQ
jgi:hypothetical protein